jgi:Domain of unknown function (DUF4168)
MTEGGPLQRRASRNAGLIRENHGIKDTIMMRFFGLACLRALIFAGLAAGVLSPAMAQEAQISDAKLQSFVVAAMKVGELIDQWAPRIEAAKTAEERAQLKGTANGELVQAIQSTGDLTVQEYQQIGQRAEGDQALQERIMKIVKSGDPQK